MGFGFARWQLDCRSRKCLPKSLLGSWFRICPTYDPTSKREDLLDNLLIHGMKLVWGGTYPRPVKWSQDGEAFYFTNVPVVEGWSAIRPNGADLQKVDLSTGVINELIPNSAFWISTSPDEKQVAAIMQVTENLQIFNLSMGETKEVGIDPGVDFDTGYIVWSPDGQHVALTIANPPCTGNYQNSGLFAEYTSIIIVNTSTLEVRKIINQDN